MTAHPPHLASFAISKELETLTNYTDALCVCLLALFFMCGTWFLGGGGAEKDKTATMERRQEMLGKNTVAKRGSQTKELTRILSFSFLCVALLLVPRSYQRRLGRP